LLVIVLSVGVKKLLQFTLSVCLEPLFLINFRESVRSFTMKLEVSISRKSAAEIVKATAKPKVRSFVFQ